MSRGRVVVGIDGSRHSRTALKRAMAEAARRGVPVDVVYVSDVSPAVLHLPGDVVVETEDIADAQRAEVWASVSDLLDDPSVEVNRVDLGGYPADELVDYCEKVDAGLLVVGTRGRGRLTSTFLGSTSLRAVERAQCDVLVAKEAG